MHSIIDATVTKFMYYLDVVSCPTTLAKLRNGKVSETKVCLRQVSSTRVFMRAKLNPELKKLYNADKMRQEVEQASAD